MAVLVHNYNEKETIAIELDGEAILIGRGPNCNIVIEDFSVSKEHVRIMKEGSSYKVEDTGSTNGTYVNGTIVKELFLEDGDRIKIGESIFVYHNELSHQTLKRFNNKCPHEKLRILIVDDSEDDRTDARALLHSLECSCDFAENGLVALQKLAMGEKYDAIFIDTKMPVMDGCTAIRKIRKSGRDRNLKIICTSSVHIGEVRRKGQCEGCLADGHIDKPFNAKTFSDMLEQLRSGKHKEYSSIDSEQGVR